MTQLQYDDNGRVIFTEEMKETYTILVPMMLPVHFELFKPIFTAEGYHLEIINTQNANIIENGWKYTHNDICYPAQLVIGQLMDALQSGKYDLNKVALMMTQTGGGCRASNYVSLLRKALAKAGLAQIPVVSLNFNGLEDNPGFKITLSMVKKLAHAVIYGDLFMLLRNQTLPYEREAGSVDRLIDKHVQILLHDFAQNKSMGKKALRQKMRQITADFVALLSSERHKIKVGVVGEIYVKFAPLGNNNLEEFLRNEDAEVVIPGLLDVLLYTIDTGIEDYRLYGGSRLKKYVSQYLLNYFENIQKDMIAVIKDFPQLTPPSNFSHTKSLAKGFIGYGAKMGEGWLLTAEMLELIDQGVNNIVCTQPFGCLPNHICGRGMIRKIKECFPEANIVPIDYDASATKVNQENRLKLMLSTGRKIAEGKI